MNAELIAIGTELLLGEIANTDGQFISSELAALGVNVYYHTVVGDNPGRLTEVINTARVRSDLIITTGGLGPTYDDMTKQTVAAAFGLDLELHQLSLDKIESFFHKIGRAMTANNKTQAMLPAGCTVLDNDWGTAPGCAFYQGGVHVIMLPGPPRECNPMFTHRAAPYIAALTSGVIASRTLRIYGMGESEIESRLNDMMTALTNPTLAPYAKDDEAILRVTARADTREEALAMCAPVVEKACGELGGVVYGVDVDSMEQCVVGALKSAGLTLAVAESCTGGLVSKRLTDISGCSDVFLGGIVAYSNKLKQKLLGVSEETLGRHGAVSAECAREMAAGAARVTGADIGVSITGIAGPGGATADKPVGLVYIAVAAGGKIETFEMNNPRGRDRVRSAASMRALDMVRRYCEGVAERK